MTDDDDDWWVMTLMSVTTVTCACVTENIQYETFKGLCNVSRQLA